ncbi:hypothetical protein W97_01495 [Coniosporium apollinis CBS 100218]|uniref:Uncharacterized protein n=1 Tax=Coniosporium apollinis (strain CBS 100218) TaxID=1168221 RepID=R7YKD8_CONA1|nr:uncharacterized protein W97_01495 [Coniosporium apollinis CBS 100218]EON62274.1 hypothetical protein W97_01495 [Coniosporium apollinis CBS 100218]
MAPTVPTALPPTIRARGMTTTLAGRGVIVDAIEPVPKAIGTGAIKRASDTYASVSSASPEREREHGCDELGWGKGKKDWAPQGKIPGCGEAEGVYLARSVGKRVARLLGLGKEKEMKREGEEKKCESKGKGKGRAVEE